MYSYDLPDERQLGNENRNEVGFSKSLKLYNGYIYQVRFCYMLYSKNELFYARIFNNQSESREELDHLHAGNILSRMAELNIPTTDYAGRAVYTSRIILNL